MKFDDIIYQNLRNTNLGQEKRVEHRRIPFLFS